MIHRTVVLSSALLMGLSAASSAQSDLAGTIQCKPGRLPKDVIGLLPEAGRMFTPPDLEPHWGLGVTVLLEAGRRPGSFDLVIDGKRRSFRVPGFFDLKLENARKKKRQHRFEIAEREEVWRVRSLSGVQFDLAKYRICLLDLDHDGAFDGEFDGWIAKPPGQRRWVDGDRRPQIQFLTEHLPIDGEKHWFLPDRDGFWVEVTTTDPRPAVDLEDNIRITSSSGIVSSTGPKQLLRRVNELRRAVGLPSITIDEEVSRACLAHALYCDVHGSASSETEGAEGYSEAGAKVAPTAIVTPGPAFPGAALDLVGGVYSRAVILDPAIQRIGIGTSKKHTVVQFVTRDEVPELPPYAWPPNRASNVPLRSPRGDDPSPLGDKSFSGVASQRYGYPITVHVGERAVTDVEFSLRIEDTEIEVPVILSWPGSPGNAARPDNAGAICAIAQAKFEPEKTYVARVTCTLGDEPFEMEWIFTTVEKR